MGNRPSSSRNGVEPVKTTLFERQPGLTYRIPALIYLRDQATFLAFAEERSSPLDCDAKLLVMRRGTRQQDGSVQWSSCEELSTARLPDHRTMNPCPVYEKTSQTVFLFFICVPGKTTEGQQIRTGHNQARLCCVTSADHGATWSATRDLTHSVVGKTERRWATFGVGPGHGIQMSGGRLVVPAYAYYVGFRCFSFPVQRTVRPHAFAVYSDDRGATWHLSSMLVGKPSCECEMAEIIDHEGRSHVYCNARSTGGGARLEALSADGALDGGLRFEPPRASPRLVEQARGGCQGSVVGFPAPKFVANDAAASGRGGSTSLLSSSDAQTWLAFAHPTGTDRRDLGVYLNRSPLHSSSGWDSPWVVHAGPAGYSDLAYDADGERFSLLMECGVESELERIAFATFALGDVTQNTACK